MLANLEETRHVLVGQSPRTRQVLRLIEKLGKCRWPALLLGGVSLRTRRLGPCIGLYLGSVLLGSGLTFLGCMANINNLRYN